MQSCNTKTNDDTTEYTHLQSVDTLTCSNCAIQKLTCACASCIDATSQSQHSLDCDIHYEVSNHSGQSCYFLLLLSHTNCNADSEDQSHSWVVIATFILTVALWLTDRFTGINANTVAMIPFCIFALTGVINKRDLEQINWSVIWMVAGGFALGYGLNASGLAANAVESIPFGEFSPLLILLMGGAICYTLSNFISNSATAALLMPILAVVCGAMGDKLAPIGGTGTILIGVAIAASSAMILPISTPPNALAFATGYVQQKEMSKIGIIMGVISMVLGFGLVYLMGIMHIL